MFRSTLALLLAIFVSACAPVPVKTGWSFNAADAEALLVPGKNTVKGSALIRQQGGGVVTCAGQVVNLIPATDYSNERVQIIYGNTSRGYRPAGLIGSFPKFANDNPAYYELTKKTICDAQGFFKFENVADGRFFVNTSIVWGTSTYVKEGGALMYEVHLTGGETKEIVLSP